MFTSQVEQPAFSHDGRLCATFCLWRPTHDLRWHTGHIEFPAVRGYRTDPDGSGLLAILYDSTGFAYRAFAADYYELDVDPAAVTHIYAGLPLDDHIVRLLNPALILTDVVNEVTTMREPHHA